MTFTEWADKYGTESARKQFGLDSHMVIVVTTNRYVRAKCGNWVASEPLGNTQRNSSVEQAIQRLRNGICNLHHTEEIIIVE